MKLSRLAAAVLMICLVGGAALAGELVNKQEVSLTLPDGWVEFTPETLRQVNANIAAALPPGKAPKYAYGFQRKGAREWLEYPYMLVRVNTAGRWPESMFREMQTIDMGKALKDKMGGKLPDVLSTLSFGAPVYDETAHMVWITGQMDVEGEGRILILSGMIPTQTGYVQIMGYAPKAAFATYAPVFRQVILSARLPADMVYQPTLAERILGQ